MEMISSVRPGVDRHLFDTDEVVCPQCHDSWTDHDPNEGRTEYTISGHVFFD